METNEMALLGEEWIGTVSHGTMIPFDVANAILDVLQAYDDEMGTDSRFTAIKGLADWICYNPTAVDRMLGNSKSTLWNRPEIGEWVNNDLWDLMNDIAPHGTYFGSHEGDGADYGFWRFEESLIWDLDGPDFIQ